MATLIHTLRTLHYQIAFAMLFDTWPQRWQAFAFILRYNMSSPAERRMIRRQTRFMLALLASDQARAGATARDQAAALAHTK